MGIVDKTPERVRAMRKQRGLTQGGLAAAAQIPHHRIQRIESGGSKAEPAELAKFALLFGVTIDYLVGLTDDPSRPGECVEEISDHPRLAAAA